LKSNVETLACLGIDKKTSAIAQKLAELPDALVALRDRSRVTATRNRLNTQICVFGFVLQDIDYPSFSWEGAGHDTSTTFPRTRIILIHTSRKTCPDFKGIKTLVGHNRWWATRGPRRCAGSVTRQNPCLRPVCG